jgi:N-acetylneuraminic acid mutarotase
MSRALRSLCGHAGIVAIAMLGTLQPALGNHFILPCQGDACTPHWVAAADMQDARTGHAATLLANGTVLVEGGEDASGYTTAGAEIYDPADNTWRRAASLNVARHGHTATLLADGRVLVTGGAFGQGITVAANGAVTIVGGGTTSSAEIYDPDRDTWTMAADMSVGRVGHTATLLANGKVLVAGNVVGISSATRYAELSGLSLLAELYDPSTDTWTPTAPTEKPRNYSAAATLADGRVLLAGGFADYSVSYPMDAEAYDVVSGTWRTTGLIYDRDIPLMYATATRLPDGRVIVAGGGDPVDWVLDGIYAFDPSSNLWSPAGRLATVREMHTATLLPDGQILFVGGYDYDNALSKTELYDPTAMTSSDGGDLFAPRSGHTATLLPSGAVLVTGGGSGTDVLRSAEIRTAPASLRDCSPQGKARLLRSTLCR